MVDIRIRAVINGFIVYDSPKERFETTGDEYVFNTLKDVNRHLEICFGADEEKENG